jgi:predicted site-specific integrase-resolvase
MSEEPEEELLKLRDVLEWTGVSNYILQQMVEAGAINPIKITPTSKNLYKKSEIKKKFFS